MAAYNIRYKDRLFTFLFGSEENKAWTLSLYNAVNNTDYKDPSVIEITTIKEIMYMGMRNDVSILVTVEMHLWEQQSTFNPNTPLRMMQYLGNLYEKYIKQRKLNKYSSKRMELPAPRLIVFFNGAADQPDEVILKLSDSFPKGSISDVEVQVRMLNINYGKNQNLLDACKPLMEYSWLAAKIRSIKKANDENAVSSAIDQAITAMPDDFVIKPFLVAHKAEVKGMLLEEYNETEVMELFKEEGRLEGREEGREEGEFNMLVNLAGKKMITIEQAAKEAGMSMDEFLQKMTLIKNNR